MVPFSMSVHMVNPIHFENLRVVLHFAKIQEAKKIKNRKYRINKIQEATHIAEGGVGLGVRTQAHIYLVTQ